MKMLSVYEGFVEDPKIKLAQKALLLIRKGLGYKVIIILLLLWAPVIIIYLFIYLFMT